jgi:hypothetical protein
MKAKQEISMKGSASKANFLRPTRRHVPEDRTLRNDRCENIKSFTYSTACRPIHSVGYKIPTAVIRRVMFSWIDESHPPFRRKISAPSSYFKSKPKEKWACSIQQEKQVYCLNYSSALKMEPIFSSETCGGFQLTTQRYIPRRENCL